MKLATALYMAAFTLTPAVGFAADQSAHPQPPYPDWYAIKKTEPQKAADQQQAPEQQKAESVPAGVAQAYDGTQCKAPGNCWKPKPGFPEKVAGSKYDPKHDPKELAKQSDSIKAMEDRNRKRVENFKATGKFVYDVDKIPAQ